MYRFLTSTLIILLVVAITIPLAAQDKKKKRKRRQQQQVRNVLKKLKKVELTKEQNEQIEKLTAEYSPKIKAAQDKIGDGSKKASEARKKAVSEGKKGRQVTAAINAALTEEQQAAWKERQSITREFRLAVAKILTEEQREKASLRLGRAGAKKKARRKNKKNKQTGEQLKGVRNVPDTFLTPS